MSLYKRIIGFWALLLLGACGFEPVYAPSTSTNSVRNNFDLSAPTDRGTYQFYHNLMGQISDNPQAQYALSYIISQSATNAATDADGKSHRGVLKGSLAYRITRKINGETVKTGNVNLHWPHLLQAMPLGAMPQNG
jgi:LPS-assembly lipoprotein